MKRFRVEHKNFEQPDMIITVHNPPYEDVDVLSKVSKKWKLKAGGALRSTAGLFKSAGKSWK